MLAPPRAGQCPQASASHQAPQLINGNSEVLLLRQAKRMAWFSAGALAGTGFE
jgi:hypothetical protein